MRIARWSIAAVLVVALVIAGWRANFFGVRTGPPFGSVATALDQPLPYPGFVWTRDGHAVSDRELGTIAGPDHCGWRTATILFIAWPLGTVAPDGSHMRQYVRDPARAMSRPGQVMFERDVRVPADARPTGYRLGAIELYVSGSDDDRWIYVVSPRDAERWPRFEPMVLCA